jgi:curved DNA-binding protein
MQFQDYYETLGVEKTASQDEIKKAYRKLSKQFHPDINKDKGAEDRFKLIGEAYEVLKDPDKRKKYDQIGTGFRGGEDFRPPQGWGGVEFNFGGGGDFGAGGVPSGFSDFFDTFFGRAGRGAQQTRRRGGPVYEGRSPFAQDYEFERAPVEGKSHEVEITIPLEDAYHGTTKSISLESEVRGPDGGRRRETKNYQVKIPAGTTDGMKIRLAGQGSPSPGGGAAGDLFLKVHLAPHPRFTVVGHDVQAVVNVSPWEAALGGKIDFATLDGEVKLTIPAGAQSGQKLRLKGKGLPMKGGERGALNVELRIVVPKELSAKERGLFEELAKGSTFDPRKV